MAFSVQRSTQPRTADQRAEILAAPGFGKYFTDHMVRIDWTRDGGWGEGQVLPYGPTDPRSGDDGAALRPGNL
jgi:branched-chain amino acid aminotransferase